MDDSCQTLEATSAALCPVVAAGFGDLAGSRGFEWRRTLRFPKLGSPLKPMCENVVNGALRRMGYGSDDMTAHGFRSSASSLLNESGKWSADAIERALLHADGNQVRAVYHRGVHSPERAEMAQWWSDYLNTLRKGAQVFAFSRC